MTNGALGAGFFPGLLVVAIIVGIVTYLCLQSDKKVKADYALHGKSGGNNAATAK